MRKRLLLAAAVAARPAGDGERPVGLVQLYLPDLPRRLYRRPRRRQLAAEQPELHHGHRLDPGRQGRL